jgi:hypothetical protein
MPALSMKLGGMADAKPLSHHFPLLMLPGDLPMVLQSEDFTQLQELSNLTKTTADTCQIWC